MEPRFPARFSLANFIKSFTILSLGYPRFAEIAQLVEHLIEAQRVGSSSLPLSTFKKHPDGCFLNVLRKRPFEVACRLEESEQI